MLSPPPAFLEGSLRTTFQPVEYQHDFKEQGWHSAESSRLPLMWPWFKSGVDAICELRLLLVLFLASRDFSPGTLVFPSP